MDLTATSKSIIVISKLNHSMKTRYIKICLALLFIFQVTYIFSQATDQSTGGSLNITTDVVSRFIWRGQNVGGSSPHIQPTLSYSKSGFEIGSWGTFGTSNDYAEVDLYGKYTSHGFTIQLTDYYNPITPTGDATSANPKFYNFKAKTTASVFELSLSYKGSENFPISLSAATFLYGNDHNYGYDPALNIDSKNYYSTYIELGYSVKVSGQNLDIFGGLTPSSGYYGNGFGFINLGIKGYRSIKITDNFSLPIYTSLITNPQAEKIYLVLGITL